MNINVHIERLVLDKLPVARHEAHLVQSAIEAELGLLLKAGGLAQSLASGGAISHLPAGQVQLSGDGGVGNESPARLGQQIARAVYEGMGG